MSERLSEFNRYEFQKKLENEEETKQLIEQVIHLVQNTFHDRQVVLTRVFKFQY